METLKKICLVLIIIGALNWALVGLFNLDLVASLFGGSDELLARIVSTTLHLKYRVWSED